MKKNTGNLTEANKEIGLDGNAEKSKYFLCLVTKIQWKIVT
jgi:hypothetical protein